MTINEFPGLELINRADLFARIKQLPIGDIQSSIACTFADRPGWLVADMTVARRVLTSAVGTKSRPEWSQRRLGGVGALQGSIVRQAKQHLIAAMGRSARDSDSVFTHLCSALGKLIDPPTPGTLTEAFSAATLTQFAGLPPGSVDGPGLRGLVVATWTTLEHPIKGAPLGEPDELTTFLRTLLSGSRSPFLDHLRAIPWSDEHICAELRGMLLAGWGSTTAATLSALALRAQGGAVAGTRFLDEVLRLYPPSFMIARNASGLGVDLPFSPGDLIVVSPWLVHRSATGWSQPQRFDITRWVNPAQPPWFMPFGVGPRRCPAATFARSHIIAGVRALAHLPWPVASALTMVEGRSPALVPSESGDTTARAGSSTPCNPEQSRRD